MPQVEATERLPAFPETVVRVMPDPDDYIGSGRADDSLKKAEASVS